MVVISFPAAAESGSTHERTALPSTCTVHAPHCAAPQPNFVPVSSSVSRKTHRSGVVGSTSSVRFCPFTLRSIAISSSLGIGCAREVHRLVATDGTEVEQQRQVDRGHRGGDEGVGLQRLAVS